MKKNKKQVRAYSLGGIVLVVLLLVFIVLLVVGGISINLDGCEGVSLASVRAAPAEVTYTDVMSDLKKDESFDPEAYPADETDYSLELVQLAESVNSELFVYVYAPAGMKATATEIRFSTAINDSFKPEDYALELLDYSGTLAKYKVKDFEVKPEALRYYDVVCVFRKWLEGVDKAPVGGQAVGSVSYPVGELWTACTLDGTVTYSMITSEVITVTDKRVGYIVYPNGFHLVGYTKCESHYVAFTTDRDIERLMEADLTYISKSYVYTSSWNNSGQVSERWQYGDGTTVPLTLTGEQTGGNDGGILTHKYSWKRIQTAKELLEDKDVTLTQEARSDLEGMQWVLRFAETEYTSSASAYVYVQNGTRISDVTILRLKFETDGVVYNLGVVDNKQTSSTTPDGSANPPNVHWWEKLFAAFKTIGSWFGSLFTWFGEHWKILLVVLGCVVGGLLVVWVIVTVLRKIAGKL